jgi:polyhydroxybutyrate depolymerase
MRGLAFGFVCSSMVAAACGGSGSAHDGPSGDDDEDAAPAIDAAPSAGCGTAPAPGYTVRTLTIDGVERSYGVLVPDGATADEPLPLVYVFHHRDGDIDAARAYGIQDAAGAAGDRAIFVYPQALPYPGEGAVGWEIACGDYDTRFADAVYDAVAGAACVDSGRVFATGFSWGADMTIAYGCCRADRMRAIAPSSGTAWGSWRDACETDDVPAFRITIGTNDGAYSVPAVHEVTETYRERNGCAATTTTSDPAVCQAYDGCDDPVIECVYPDMGHQIPDQGAERIWAFFRQF